MNESTQVLVHGTKCAEPAKRMTPIAATAIRLFAEE